MGFLQNAFSRFTGLQTRSQVAAEQAALKARHRSVVKKVFTRAYEAGVLDRTSSDWSVFPTTADQDVRLAILQARQRARDLEENEPLGAKFINLCRKNIPGPYGFHLKVKSFDIDPQGDKIYDRKANATIEEAWKDWSKIENCEVSAALSFRSVQHLVIAHAFRDGEFIVRKIKNNSKYGFQLQPLEPDLIDERWTHRVEGSGENGNTVIMGIEFDQWRRIVAFWLRKAKPEINVYGGLYYSAERERVSTDEIYYGFDRTRAFQSRGMTKMSPSMRRMRMLFTYEKAAVTNAAISARRLAFLTPNTEKGALPLKGDDEDSEQNVIIDTEDGIYQALPKGWEVNQPDPKYPDAQHEMFVKAEGKTIATGLDVSYSSLTGDLKEANYGSQRGGLLEERETWMMHQQWFTESFLEPVYRDWLKAAIMTNNLPGILLSQFEKYNKPVFTGRTWPWIDPEKDVSADLKALRSGQKSLYRVAAEHGDDIEEVFQEIAAQIKLAKKYGITLQFEDTARATESAPPDEGAAAPDAAKKPGNGKPSAEEAKAILESI